MKREQNEIHSGHLCVCGKRAGIRIKEPDYTSDFGLHFDYLHSMDAELEA